MTRFRGRNIVVMAILAWGCGKPGPSPTPAASASALPETAPAPRPSAVPAPVAAPTESAPGETALPTKACRAITVKGTVTAEGGRTLTAGAPLDEPVWLDLAAGAQLAVKHADTAREIVFHGPGRVLPCDRGEERFLMTRGRAVTATWAGARPGAEVLIATPLAVVRYGDATLDVRLDPGGLSVQGGVGDGFIDVGDGSGGERVSAGGHAERKGGALDVKALVGECDNAARAAESLARDVLAPRDPTVPLGKRASVHVLGRKAARMKCAMAAAALGTLEKGQDRDDLGRAVAHAEATWRGVPSTRRAAVPPRE